MHQPPSGFGPGRHLDVVDDPVHNPNQATLKPASPLGLRIRALMC